MATQTSKDAADALSQPTAAPGEAAKLAGVRDANYNLISVVYHALKAAEACEQYVRDAEAAGDEQLAQFFEEARGSHIELAQEAKLFLAERLDPTEIEEDPPTVG